VPTIDTDHLWQLASARWAEIGAKLPDLAPAIALQRRMLRLVLDASVRINPADLPGQPAPAILEKLRRGLPALRGENVQIPSFLKEIVPLLCTALAEGGAGDSVLHIRDAVVNGDVDAGSLLSLSLARNQRAIRTSALHMGFSPDLIWLVGELGSSPLAYVLQTKLLRTADLQVGLTDWDRGYCPCCGSWPAFIEVYANTRALRCSFCAAAWQLTSHRCVYCRCGGEDFITAALDLDGKNSRVELCRACGSYTKVIDVSTPTPFPLLAIEDLASTDLDAGAMSREYQRPPLYDLESEI
jgi:hypothetical protein